MPGNYRHLFPHPEPRTPESPSQQRFDRFCATINILPINDEVIVKAAEIYGDLHRRGELIGDADILIAATALVNGLAIITNNEKHFERITGLGVENWLIG